MKSSVIKFSIAAVALAALFFTSSCKHDHAHESGEGHGTEEKAAEENHDDHGHEKMVYLNHAQFAAAGIDTGWLEKKNLSEVINANGYTKLPPQNQAQVSSVIPGIIKSISVIEGQHVNAGQTLATLQSPEIAKMQEAYFNSKSNLEFLELEFERQKKLSEENVNSKKVFQKTQAELQNEKARYQSLKEQLALLHLDNSEQIVSSVPIKAPINGHITEVYVTIGSAAEPGKILFSIVDNSKMHVDLLVYEKDLFKVKEGQTVRFVLTNQNNQEVPGKIFSVGKAFENETKSVAVHADILNEKAGLIPGMYVNALIDVGATTVDALPEEAIVQAEGREFIFIWEKENLETKNEAHAHEEGAEHKHEEGEAHDESEHAADKGKISFARVEVKTGVSQLGYKQVTLLQEVHDGDKIVVKGAYYLQSHLTKEQGGGGHEHGH